MLSSKRCICTVYIPMRDFEWVFGSLSLLLLSFVIQVLRRTVSPQRDLIEPFVVRQYQWSYMQLLTRALFSVSSLLERIYSAQSMKQLWTLCLCLDAISFNSFFVAVFLKMSVNFVLLPTHCKTYYLFSFSCNLLQ